MRKSRHAWPSNTPISASKSQEISESITVLVKFALSILSNANSNTNISEIIEKSIPTVEIILHKHYLW